MYLNLDQNFRPFEHKEEIKFESFTFSGGEPHIKLLTDVSHLKSVHISHRIQSFNDVGILLLAVNALKVQGIKEIHLLLPYFPGARQDRLMVVGEALTVKVYADIINQQQFESVTIFDPHSEVTPALLNHCTVIENYTFIQKIVSQLPKDLLLISPDGGALKKIYKVAAHLQNYEVVECSKSRDVRTGKLSGFKVYSEDLKGKDCLIVDDICDGGGTFLGLAKALKQKGAGHLYLAVSHGIFSKGLEVFSDEFKHIFTTDAFQQLDSSSTLTQIPLSDGLLS